MAQPPREVVLWASLAGLASGIVTVHLLVGQRRPGKGKPLTDLGVTAMGIYSAMADKSGFEAGLSAAVGAMAEDSAASSRATRTTMAGVLTVAGLMSAVVASHAMDVAHFVRVALGDWSRAVTRPVRQIMLGPEHGGDAGVLDVNVAWYRVWPQDVDRNAHMNNAKFLRVGNYSRRSLWAHNGVWGTCLSAQPHKVNLIVTATTIRYRRELKIWQRYRVESRLLSWDNQCFYTEHRFKVDDFVHAVQLVKYRVVSEDKTMTPAKLLSLADDTVISNLPPALTPELASWLEYDKRSSLSLRGTTK